MNRPAAAAWLTDWWWRHTDTRVQHRFIADLSFHTAWCLKAMHAMLPVTSAHTLTKCRGRQPKLLAPPSVLLTFFFTAGAWLTDAHTPHDVTEALAATPDGRHVWTISRHRLYYSDNFGLNWRSGHGAGLPRDVVPSGWESRLVVSPNYNEDNTVFFLTCMTASDDLNETSCVPALFRTETVGMRWVAATGLPPSMPIGHVRRAGSFSVTITGSQGGSKGRVVLATIGKSLARSVDWGSTFTFEIRDSPLNTLLAASTSEESKLPPVFATENGGVVWSLDFGKTWAPLWQPAGTMPLRKHVLGIAETPRCTAAVAGTNPEPNRTFSILIGFALHVVCLTIGSAGLAEANVVKLAPGTSLSSTMPLGSSRSHVMYSADLWLESGAFANTASAKKKNVAILKHLGAKLTDVQRAVTRAAMKEEKAVAAGKLDKVSHAKAWVIKTQAVGALHDQHWNSVRPEGGLVWSAQAIHTAISTTTYSFSHLSASPTSDTVFLGSYSGIFRSTDGGRQWRKLDIQNPLITSVQLALIPPDSAGSSKAFVLGVCTYQVGCYRGEVDVDVLRDGVGSPLRAWSKVRIEAGAQRAPDNRQGTKKGKVPARRRPLGTTARSRSCISARYNTLALSPQHSKDGVTFIAVRNCLMRSDRSGVAGSWTQIGLKRQSPERDFIIHNIVFSPAFSADGTIFLAGFNIGIAVSQNRGLSFKTLWDAGGVATGGANVHVAVSPGFQTDLTLAAVIGRPPIPEGCTVDDTFVVAPKSVKGADGKSRTVHCYAGFDKFQGDFSSVSVSTNGGRSWGEASSTGKWHDVALILEHGNPAGVHVVGVESGHLLSKPAAVIGASGWCHVGGGRHDRNGIVGRNGVAVDQHLGEVFAGFANGGAVLRKLGSTNCSSDPSIFIPIEATRGAVVQASVPAADHLRGVGSMVTFSPRYKDDGIIFVASSFSISASVDRGATWKIVLQFNQTTRECDGAGFPESMPNCDICRSAAEKQPSFDVGYLEANCGGYCLQCAKNAVWDPSGKCKPKRKEGPKHKSGGPVKQPALTETSLRTDHYPSDKLRWLPAWASQRLRSNLGL